MCCLRFGAGVLLSNIYGNPNYNGSYIKIFDFLKNEYCDYLNDILPGYKFYSDRKEDVEEFVNKYIIFEWKYGIDHTELKAIPRALNPDYYNRNYPDDISDKLVFAADICLSSLNKIKTTVNSKVYELFDKKGGGRQDFPKLCRYGKTPMQTFTDSIPLAKEKLFGYDVSDGQSA